MSSVTSDLTQAVPSVTGTQLETLQSRLIMVENECAELHRLLSVILTKAKTINDADVL